MAERARPPHRLGWPWTDSQVEAADEQFFELYKRVAVVESRPIPLSGTKVYYVSDSSGGAVTRKLTFQDGLLISET